MWNAQTIKFFSFQFNEQNENFVFSWFLSSHVMCVIFSVIWIQSVQTSVLFCYRHQYSAFVKSMRFLSDILLIYHHVWVLINMKKSGIFRSLQFYRVPRWSFWAFIVIDDHFAGAGIRCSDDEEARRTIICFFGHTGWVRSIAAL